MADDSEITMLGICEKVTASVYDDEYETLKLKRLFKYFSDEVDLGEDTENIWLVRRRIEVRNAESFKENLPIIKELRAGAVVDRDTNLSLTSRLDLLRKYFRHLSSVESNLDEEFQVRRPFYPPFEPPYSDYNQLKSYILSEKVSATFNIGAVYSQIGLSYCGVGAEGNKQTSPMFLPAAGAFLAAAGAFTYPVNHLIVGDASFEYLILLQKLMLAQAQECVYESFIVTRKNTPVILSKISRQASVYYEEALAELINQLFDKDWIAHVLLKAAFFYAEACYWDSLELHEKKEIGEEIARLDSGVSVLLNAKKSSKGAAQQLINRMNKLEATLNQQRIKEISVCSMRVPEARSLAPLPTLSLVKQLPFSEKLGATGEKMFANLTPDSSAEFLAMYTEKADKVIRTQTETVQRASELAQARLKEMNLPDSIHILEAIIPTALEEAVERVHARYKWDFKSLEYMRQKVQKKLVKTEKLLQEAALEFDAKLIYHRHLNWFASKMKQAEESDGRIEQSMSLISLLDLPPTLEDWEGDAGPEAEKSWIESRLPMMSLDSNQDAIVGALKQSLRDLETLGAQREDMLKGMDDILVKLMTSTGSFEDLFREAIAKYDHMHQKISQNIVEQEKLLLQIQAQNDNFTDVINLKDHKASRERCHKEIEAAIAKYWEIVENICEGVKLYRTLEVSLIRLKMVHFQKAPSISEQATLRLALREPPTYLPPQPRYPPYLPPHLQPYPGADVELDTYPSMRCKWAREPSLELSLRLPRIEHSHFQYPFQTIQPSFERGSSAS